MDMKKLIESLSPNEIKILPHMEENIDKICEKSGLDKVSVLRALEYLGNKKIVEVSQKKEKIIELGINGALYRKKQLPERRLLDILVKKRILSLDNLKESNLSDEELKASIGVLKKKDIIDLKNKKIILKTGDISKKLPEEIFLESLPLNYESLSEEQIKILKSLGNRKDITRIKEEKTIEIKITELGKKIIGLDIKSNLIEQVTPELLKKDSLWKGKKFRRYNLTAKVPEIYGGKRHFVDQAVDYGRKIWTDMGFQEMTGNIIQTSFWNFDALFTAQDHPVREMQDTFFINKKEELSDKEIIKAIKESHEGNIKGLKSKGWDYSWNEEEAKKLVLRTHTTCLSAQTLAKLKKEDLPAKFFALGKCFRNETVDWSHGFEFNQTEGIVIDPNANFRHLLGYLKQFFKKMGFEKVRFRPAYFPYTEPSVEVDVFHEGKKQWLELGGAGIFRPEVVIPLLGENIPVLAWGPGFDRILMDYYEIKDLRELYKNNLTQLRKIKSWIK
jgi:phenylalanyl-tRNA synthetase alpha chain|tara:strand:+ start:143 stop:1648 length:1506 start_codon:yes stop_codon:yes gene_type:complete